MSAKVQMVIYLFPQAQGLMAPVIWFSFVSTASQWGVPFSESCACILIACDALLHIICCRHSASIGDCKSMLVKYINLANICIFKDDILI